jgi:hypothetical protein
MLKKARKIVKASSKMTVSQRPVLTGKTIQKCSVYSSNCCLPIVAEE